ncbi:helix-turn-helix domain-containing protein [Candidatus Woesearchaeota archaeon]|nr:helix-turn-helix domain-containing protein [Candidatus Woesearchaeota archaeon]
MNLRQAVIGVHHHDCWGTLSTEKFPEINMKENGPVIIQKNHSGLIVHATWDVSFPKVNMFNDYLDSLKRFSKLKTVRVIGKGERTALLKTVWKANNSSYDAVIKNNCFYSSPVSQINGYEIYTVIAEKPMEIKKLMNELSVIGEAKMFKIGDFQREETPFTLTDKQLSALQIALSNNYYAWPRTIGLDELSRLAHLKRRTFQENLRKAEAKVFPNVLDTVLFRQN